MLCAFKSINLQRIPVAPVGLGIWKELDFMSCAAVLERSCCYRLLGEGRVQM